MGLIRKEDLHDSLLNSLSNSNLLINGDFQINQRDKTNYTNGYTIDRWMLSSDANLQLDVLDKGVRITAKSLGTWDNFSTKIDCSDFKHLLGKTLTLTFKLLTPTTKINQIWGMCRHTENEHFYFSYVLDANNFYKDGPISIISKTFTIDQIYSDGYIEFGIQIKSNAGDSIELEWAKLEIGDHLTPFVPRPYGEELALCKRYYQYNPSDSYFLFHRSQGGGLRCDIPSESMRATPSLVFPSETIDFFNSASKWESISKSNCSVFHNFSSQISLFIDVNTPGLSEYRTYIDKNIPCFDAEIY